MRVELKKRIPQVIALAIVATLAALAATVVWAAKGSPSVQRAGKVRSAVAIAGGSRTVQLRQSARPARVSAAKAVPSPAQPTTPRAASAAVSSAGPAASGAALDPALCAVAGTAPMPDGSSVPIWGF